MNINDLTKEIQVSGIIRESDIAQLKRELYSDGAIDQTEADLLFGLNDACAGANNHADWPVFFSEAICSFLLNDENSPGVVDESEASWLLEKVQGDGTIDTAEIAVLQLLKKKATSLPENLQSLINQYT